ncbi:MAG: shikimate kinase [Gammaproteobacteria bacterium]|jgi:shikimate kinase|nr:shikimate kinase [Gammaproteobacteria bacterium]
MMIYLIGPMGSGKTTIGKILSSRLKYQFFDTDEEIKKKIGMSISSIFDKKGESGFRIIESQILEELSIKPRSVISTGGGIVLMKENRVIMKNGTCIYLKIDFERQRKRLANSDDRPLISKSSDGLIRKTNAAREPYFIDLANIVIDTSSLNENEVTQQILNSLKS